MKITAIEIKPGNILDHQNRLWVVLKRELIQLIQTCSELIAKTSKQHMRRINALQKYDFLPGIPDKGIGPFIKHFFKLCLLLV